jgi:hypothetical protein
MVELGADKAFGTKPGCLLVRAFGKLGPADPCGKPR